MDPILSYPPSSIKNMQQWLNHLTKTFNNHLQTNTYLPICIFQIPETLSSQKPASYIPQHIGLGPIHHFQTSLLHNKQKQLKLITSKNILTRYKVTSDFQKVIQEKLIVVVPLARSCYDIYFDIEDECLAWVFAIDALFLLSILLKEASDQIISPNLDSFDQDVTMVENQIPLVILVELLNELGSLHLSDDFDNLFLPSLLVKYCETRLPFKFTTQETLVEQIDITNRFHLLDCMYHVIVNHKLPPKNPFLRVNLANFEDVENVVQIAGGLFPVAHVFLQPILVLLKLPWDKISGLISKILGENHTMLPEIDIPSVSKLTRIGRIEICSTLGGIHDIEFDDKKLTFCLPVIDLKSHSEVIFRNLVAYEELMFKKGNFTQLDFTEYVDLMCGIIDDVKDVNILRENNVIEGDMDDEEIVKLFNGITKSGAKMDGKKSDLQTTIANVNKYYGNIPRVKVLRFIKKLFLASWKILAILFSIVGLTLMIVTSVCQVYECKDRLGLSNARLVVTNQLVDF
uniref:putative UPF0481 protein At3g02645 n=1 Tax=Erigeron canadensis TaxID=72917 RepID=UPI001CB9BC19|nr:putative UPF0481 protein At3g02645 [Erigeron canadensis]